MKNRNPDTLAQAMRDEAMSDSPAFSALLHERIMQRVREARRQPSAPRQRGHRHLWLAISAAAVLALAIGLIASLHGPATSERTVTQAEAEMLPTPEKIVSTQVVPVHDRLVASLDAGKLAYLDRDARDLTNFVKGRLSLVMVSK